MRLQLVAAVILLVALSTTAKVSERTHRLFDKTPRSWTRGEKADPTTSISIVFAVKQRNLDVVEDWLLKSSNPQSPFFGQHLSRAAVHKLTTNTDGLTDLDAFLRANGVETENIELFADNFIRARMPVSVASEILDTEFHHYTHTSGKTALRTHAYTVPAEVSHAVEFVSVLSFPTVRKPLPRTVIDTDSSVDDGAIPPGYTVPSVLYKYYGVSKPAVSTSSATCAVYESLGQSFAPTDLSYFQNYFALPSQSMGKVIGPNTPTACAQDPNNCVEANLDVQYLNAIAQGSPMTYWSIASSDPSPWVDWILAVANTTTPPLVHSVSYGEVETQDDPTAMNRFNSEVMKLGARGITVILASGDDGVANFPARGNPSACGFQPSFPATAPYVTAVGATMGPENGTAEIAETSDQNGGITTGGGFSTVFSQPSWQSSAVATYFKNSASNLPPKSQFASTGRGYPDVAIIGHNYVIADGGQLTAGSGTSASAPVFAGMVTLVNSQRLAAGKSSLGFLNQILYQTAVSHPEVFNDITKGKNNCAAADPTPTCCTYGFTAAQGWDPLTGLGSINFASFSKVLSAL